jgi:hypothetical protein
MENIPDSLPQNQEAKAAQELRSFFGQHARVLAAKAEHGDPINPRELMLLVNAAREIISFEARA